MTVAFHVDFHGRDTCTGGWFLCGWSNPWPSDPSQVSVTAQFADGAIGLEYVSAFYGRPDIDLRDVGFILFIRDDSATPSELASVGISFHGEAIGGGSLGLGSLRLGDAELRERLSPLVSRLPPDQQDRKDYPFYALQRAHQIEIVRSSSLLEEEFYIANAKGSTDDIHDAFEHFHDVGYRKGIKPNFYFDPTWYLETYTDVAECNLNPLYHYAKWGDLENRKPSLLFDPAFYRRRYSIGIDTCALAHYLQHRHEGRFSPNNDFDVESYLANLPQPGNAGIDPFEHYFVNRSKRGQNPSMGFGADGGSKGRGGKYSSVRREHRRGLPNLAEPGGVFRHRPRLTTLPIPGRSEAISGITASLAIAPGARLARKQAGAFVARVLSSPFVDDDLCQGNLGAGRGSVHAAERYLLLPPAVRPRISYFFDGAYYLARYPDLASRKEFDPLIHFILTGCGERRSPHPLVDIDYMRSRDPHILSERPSTPEVADILQYDLIDPSPYFVIEEYRSQLPDGDREITGCLCHYLKIGHLLGLKPNRLFDPAWYYRQLEEPHDLWSGLRHFVLTGDNEGRAPSPAFSPARYRELNPDVGASSVPPLFHYLVNGRAEKRPYAPLPTDAAVLTAQEPRQSAAGSRIDQVEAVAAYRRNQDCVERQRQAKKDAVKVSPVDIVRLADPNAAIPRLAFPRFRTPKVSILVPVYNELAYTVECLASILRSAPKVSYEVIVADDASPDKAIKKLRHIKNLRYIRQPRNVGFLENCNASFGSCHGDYLLHLNNDAQLMPGALDALVGVLEAQPDVAAVGPKILYPNGRLQEAGCVLDRDGVSTMVGLFADPTEPSYAYDRDVHYCSGAALLVRRGEVGEVLFDPAFKPAYCEDADLCLRLLARGRRVVYCHQAEVVHHLTVSMNRDSVTRRLQAVARNQQKLTEKWSGLLQDVNTARVIAMYLPQFHTTPENDFYWGQGFTEWRNVAKAEPAYVGHYQPHLPADLGFYDLRVKQTIERQAALAQRYGVAGFCVYYYNFGERRALDQAFEAIVADRSIDFPFCVCWANENWTRHWDGGTREIIFEQRYDRETLSKIIDDAMRYAEDPRYLRVNGKPLFLVYRPLLIPDTRQFTDGIREAFRQAGFPGVHLVYVESMESAAMEVPPDLLGFDASVEFPPHGNAIPVTVQASPLRDGFVGKQYDYEASVMSDVSRAAPGYRRYPAVFPSWDNTPRQPLRGDSFVGATPEAFQVCLEEKLERLRNFFVGDERLLFVNAWNEWAEGTHLEPDVKFGHRWLEAVHNALMAKSLL